MFFLLSKLLLYAVVPLGLGLLLVVTAIHIAAALYHHFVLKDGVLRRMLPFSKPSA